MTTGGGELDGQVCIVTGAGGGIGRATALALAGAGGRVALLDWNIDHAKETGELIVATGGEAIALRCDVSSEGSVAEAAAASLAALGPADVLVNNAGILRPGALAALPLSEWNALLSVNLTGCLLCSQAFGAQMQGRGGSLVHVASIAAAHATPFAGAYSVAKAGVVMLSRQLAVELGASGIRSNVVSPGLILTPMTQDFYDKPGMAERRSAIVPAGRIGQADDIARAICFLASSSSSYLTGEELVVDGGLSRALMGLIPRPGFDR